MYGISPDLNLSDIVGSEIHLIGLGRYDVQFHFDSGRTICVQGDVQVLEGNELAATWNDENNWSSIAFQTLLNVKVIGYSVPNNRLLEIRFERDLVLHLYDSSDQYETMQIYPEGFIV